MNQQRPEICNFHADDADTANQWGIAWNGAEERERESERVEADREERKTERIKDGEEEFWTSIKQLLMSINSTFDDYTNEERDPGWHLDSPSPS